MCESVEITPAMLEAGNVAFGRWMQRWDWLAEGSPDRPYVDGLLCSIFCAMSGRHKADAAEVIGESVEVHAKLVGDFDEFSKRVILLGGV